MKKYLVLAVVVLAGVVLASYFIKSNGSSVPLVKNQETSAAQFSWDVVVDRSACDSHMCDSDLYLNYGEHRFQINDYIRSRMIGQCGSYDGAYADLREQNPRSNLPTEDSLVTYKDCLVMGGGSLYYVLDQGTGYQVMEKEFSDADYSSEPSNPRVIFVIEK